MWLTIVRLDSEPLAQPATASSANPDSSSSPTTQLSVIVDQLVLQEASHEPQLMASHRLQLSDLASVGGAAAQSRLSRALSSSQDHRDEFLRKNLLGVFNAMQFLRSLD